MHDPSLLVLLGWLIMVELGKWKGLFYWHCDFGRGYHYPGAGVDTIVLVSLIC